MRDYAKFSPCFWTGDFGKSIRGKATLQALAAYLISAPTGNMAGIFSLPLGYAATDLGLTARQVLQALRGLEALGFAHYDQEQETVWVVEQARHELGESLEPGDNKVKSLRKLLAERRKSFLVRRFLDLYAEAYHLQDVYETASPEAPCEGAYQAPCGGGEDGAEACPEPLDKGSSRVRHARTGGALALALALAPALPGTGVSPARARDGRAARARSVPAEWTAVGLPVELDDDQFRAAWAVRLQERAEKPRRDQPTATQLAAQLGKLAKYAANHGIPAAIACVERATERGWRGVVFDDSPTDGTGGRAAGYRSAAAERRAQGSDEDRRKRLHEIDEEATFRVGE